MLEGEPFVLVNGDTLVDVDLSEVLALHAEKGAIATMVLADAQPGDPYSVVAVDEDLRVRDIAGRTGWKGRAARLGHFCGIHVIEPRIFDAMPDSDIFCINADVYPRLLAAGETIQGCFLAGRFSDVGTPARYLETAGGLLDGSLKLRYQGESIWSGTPSLTEKEPGLWIAGSANIDKSAVLKAPAYIGDRAVVEAGASIGPYTIMGRESRAERGSRADHTVAWEGAVIPAGESLHRTVITPRQRLRVLSP